MQWVKDCKAKVTLKPILECIELTFKISQEYQQKLLSIVMLTDMPNSQRL